MTRPRSLGAAICLAALFAQPVQARPQASALPAEERQVAACIERTAKGRPWLARTLWGLRDQERGWIGAAVRNSNGTEDLGPLQVNSWWASRIAAVINRDPAQVRRWLRDDACFNVDSARWIFLSALGVTKDYWKAVGLYHSPIGWRQNGYAIAVSAKLSARFGTSIFQLTRAR
jgi:hypothetical protein